MSDYLADAAHVTAVAAEIARLADRPPTDQDDVSYSITDLHRVRLQHAKWNSELPNVRPFYAVKCNPDARILRVLAEKGAGFDCASRNEIKLALEMPNITPDDIIYANCLKPASHLVYAKSVGVRKMTFDCVDELHKIAKHYGNDAQLVLRFAPDDSDSVCVLSNKFGADYRDARSLCVAAKELGLEVVGVSFHVGSGAALTKAWIDAVYTAKQVLEAGQTVFPNMKLVDVGGGFPALQTAFSLRFEEIARDLSKALRECFPLEDGYALMGEPGRFMVGNSTTLITRVVGVREVVQKGEDTLDDVRRVFVNDGTYGSFNCVYNDHITFSEANVFLYENEDTTIARLAAMTSIVSSHESTASECTDEFVSAGSDEDNPAKRRRVEVEDTVVCSLWGPTCDGRDCIADRIHLPSKLACDSVLVFPMAGAYTSAAASRFNGFDMAKTIYIDTENGAKEAQV